MIYNYFKIAWRNLVRHKRMTIINVAGLGIGMAATVLIVLWVQNELSFDTFQPDSANIYRIKTKLAISKTETWVWENSQYILGDLALKQIPEIENLTRIKPNDYADLNFRFGDKLIAEKKSAYVDAHWFDMFHYDFLEGSADDFAKNPLSLALTQSTAKKYFGNADAMGKVLRVDSINYQVRAIVKDNPANSSFQFNVLIPIDALFADASMKANDLDWGNYNYQTFLKLHPGASAAKVTAKITALVHAHVDSTAKNETSFSLLQIKDIHFENDVMNSSIIHGNRVIVNVFIALAVLMLMMACINYVNLTTARASIRSKEVSIRKIVGARRLHLFGQFMSESFVVSLMALILAVVLVQASLPWFQAFTDKHFDNPLSSPTVWVIIGLTLSVSFILNGLYPAALLSSFNPLQVFKGKAMLNFKDTGIRQFLVVLQFTISVILIISTLVIYTQLNYIQKADLGYDRSQVFTFNIPWKVWGMNFKQKDIILNTIKQDLKSQGVIADVTMASNGLVDFQSTTSGSFNWAGKPKGFEATISPLLVDADFARIMKIKVKEGRWFTNEISDKRNFLVNETAVAMLHLQKPIIGQRMWGRGDTGVIVGVVKDFHYRSLHDKIGPMIMKNNPGGSFYIKTSGNNAAAAIVAAQKVWQKYVPAAPFNYTFLDETYNNLYKAEQQSSVLISIFALIAIFVSALGLLGLAAFAAEQKVKEIGIRKVLGASIQNIVSLLSVDFLKMVIIASIIAFPIGWYAMNKWLQNFAYRMDLSWWIFLLAAGIALLIAIVTVSIQAVKAAIANPVNSLRSE